MSSAQGVRKAKGRLLSCWANLLQQILSARWGFSTYSDALFYSLLAPSSLSSIGGCLEGFVSFFYLFSPFLVSFVNSSSLMIS
jgi:hypothetical protein